MSAGRRGLGALTGPRRSFSAIAVVVVLAVAGQGAAQAYVARAYAPPSLVMTERPPTSLGEVRATLSLTLLAHEARLLRAESVSDSGTPDRNAIGQKITCEDASGAIVKESWTGTNLLTRNGRTLLTNRLLFVAPTAGTYQCRIRVYVNSHYAQPARAVLRSAFVGDVFGTLTTQRLGVSRQSAGAWLLPAGDRTVRRFVPVFRYRPPAGATAVDARADVYLTNCYGPGGAGCPRGTFPARGTAGYAMQAFLVPSNRACATVASATKVGSFDWATHHTGVPFDLHADLPRGVDCGSWSTYTTVQWVSGLPFVVHRYPYSQASIIGS